MAGLECRARRDARGGSWIFALSAGDDPDLAAVGAAGFLGDHGEALCAFGAPDLAIAGDLGVGQADILRAVSASVARRRGHRGRNALNEAKAAPEGGTTAIAMKAAATIRKNMIIG